MTGDVSDRGQSRSNMGCIFCGGKPCKKEHGVAQWIGELLHQLEPPGATWETHYQFGMLSAEPEERRHGAPGNRPVVELNRVCIPCNNGWMADLEAQAKPFMSPMILGKATRLDLAAQLVVATWAVKTAMVLEFMRRELFVATPEVRSFLMNTGQPPDTYRVRLGNVESPAAQPLRCQTFVGSTQGPTGLPDVLCTTLLLAHLAVQVAGGLGVGPVDLGAVGRRTHDAVMVWPPVPPFALWPPEGALDETQVETFMREPIPGATDGLVKGW